MAYTEQKQRAQPIFAGYDAAKRAWGNTPFRLQNGVRSEVGSEMQGLRCQGMDKPRADVLVDDVSDWPQRLGAHGNAVVPLIPELIGNAILKLEAA